MQHNLGTYNNLKEVWNRYPNGGGHGDYVIIDGEKLYWNELQTSWGDYEYEPEIIRPGIVYEGDIKVEGTGTFHEGIKIGDSIPGYSGALIDEFGNADYRRVNTDSLFIRDEESGNLVSLAKYIVRFKTELPPNWAEYQKLPLFNSARLLLFDGTSESRYYTTIKDLKDAIAAQIEATSGGEGSGSSIVVIRSDDETVAPSDSNVFSSLATLRQIDLALQFATGAFLSRLHSDTAQGHISFQQGITVNNGAEIKGLTKLDSAYFGEYTHKLEGGVIDSAGNAELESLALRSFLEVPTIRYNELEYIGEEIIIGAGAVLKGVEHLGDDTYRLTLKLEDGQLNPFRPSDLLKGIYNMDENGNFTGFGTTYVSVSSIDEHDEHEMIVILADESDVVGNRNMPPRKFMHLARIGNFTDTDRQSYISLSAKDRAITQYGGVNAFAKKNKQGKNVRAGAVTTQWGRAEGLEFIDNFDNLPITKDSDVLYTDTLLYNKQIKVDYQGVVIKEYIDRGQWFEGMECQVTETTIDEVWYEAEKFRLIDRPIENDPFVTTEKPTRESDDWMLILSFKEEIVAPIIIDGFWAFWDSELQKFVESEFSAIGDDGHSPYVDVLTGTWWEWSPELGEFKDTFIKAEGDKGDKGEDGYTPVKGTDYFDGVDGQDGESKYLWIRYSQNSNGNPFVTDPTNAKYIGIATTLTDSPPSNYLSYDWSLIKGTDGIAGEDGEDGQTSYLHIKYSNDGTTFTANNGETVGAWIGTYVDFIEEDSMDFSKYTWNKVKGEDGKDGEDGADGADGKDGKDGLPPEIDKTTTQYALGESKTEHPTAGWIDSRDDLIPNKTTPYEWSRQKITYKDSTQVIYVGYVLMTNISPASYMFGEWDLRVAYTRNDKSYPIVTYKRANNKPLYYYPKKEGVIGYEYFVTPPLEPTSGWYKKGDIVWYENTSEDYPVILGLYKANKDTRFNPYSDDWDNVTADYAPNGIEGQKLWEFADGVELIITEALMANFAKLDSFVFNKGKMFSQEGTLNGIAGSVDYTNKDHKPNFEVEGVSGKVKMRDAEIEGRVIATSGNLDSVTVTNADIKNATIDGLLKVSSGYEGKIGDYNLFWIAPMSAKILTVPTTYDSKGKSIKFYNASSTVSHTLNLLVIGYKLNSNGEIVLTNYTLSDEAKGARKDSVFIPPRGSVEVSCFEIPPGNYKSTGGDSDVYDRVLSWEMTNRDYYNSPE